MQPASVRQATSADLAALVPLFDGYRQFYGQPSERDRVREFLNERLTQGDSVLFIAEAAGRAVGFTQLYPSFSSISMARIFILNDLFVVPEARRSGVARRLLEAAVGRGREAGAIRLSLSTALTNAAAQALYASAGWERDVVFGMNHYPLLKPIPPTRSDAAP
ncbi:GNAT family N-acetyltransferase [Synechococcus sp. BA-132 BA5]|uniref:GNAT family N-acetyltransferase n=1 Tax=Synechococcus sp. BA-132 BA5 TaxID=3110252 RepID=UPI002B2093BB|nr:GNAT family N-acetyltransferase [Synechococcus sp. BA-132 BA5]MEA5416405.1 GNAT family N-acetyltransferase [Synechococcus sp. BA-132 BA5]